MASEDNAPEKSSSTFSSSEAISHFEFNTADYDCDDSTKISALRLALESKSTTKPLEDKELNLFRELFQDALSLQNPALRQVFIAQTNKLIKRIKDSHRVVMRDRKLFTDEQRDSITERYKVFIEWLAEFCFDSIYCNAYFGSFILTLSTLKLIIQHITFDDKDIPIRSLFGNKRCYDSILTCLNDSFEENKALALELLYQLPENQQFLSESNLDCFEKIAYQLVESVNPAHSLTCQYIFRMVVSLRSKHGGLTKNQLLKKTLFELVGMLDKGVEETQEDFVAALKSRPIYPKLTCIRALLNDIDIKDIENERGDWESLAKMIVTASIAACKTVSMIVCNLNPETIGHLPMDLKPVDPDMLSKAFKVSLKVSDVRENVITSQMLLIAGWKTIKECSLSLGAMCVRFWWPKEKIRARKEKFPGLEIDPILDSSEIEKIIDFFDHYLRNLRHRGAFEQAYNGFMLVTRRIWHDQHFRNLLTETLHQIMNDFKCDIADEERATCLKAYVTRRSAGLPFIVQAILNSEHKHDSKTLRWVMDCLFEVLGNKNVEEYQRIHSLNILRALIKESALGEKVISYVGQTFVTTLESFESESFPVRNCANMLLKATVDRKFGSNRLRDEIHRKNQLSFERFFTECPGLMEKMLEYLEKGLLGRKGLACVHAVFVILSRLRPGLSPSRDFTADKVIKPFIEPILELAYTCHDYNLRELAAKLAVRLENFCICEHDDEIDRRKGQSYHLERIRDVVFKNQPNWDRNKLHGSLCLTKNWIENSYLYSDNKQHCELLSFAHQMVRLVCLSDKPIMNCSIKAAALDLAQSCCLIRPDDNGWLAELNSLYNLIDSYLKVDQNPNDPQFERLVFKFFTVLPMGIFPCITNQSTGNCYQYSDALNINRIVDLTLKMIVNSKPSRNLSVNLLASMIRFLRQLLSQSTDFVDGLLVKFDIDLSAAHVTPYDELKFKSEYDPDRRRLKKYCEQNELRAYLKQAGRMYEIFNLYIYDEFTPNADDKFSAKISNTPRSIELLIFVLKNWEEFNLENRCFWVIEDETITEKIEFLLKFIKSLPDCDVKCLALLCAGKLFNSATRCIPNDIAQSAQTFHLIGVLNRFTSVLDDLSDGDHGVVMRETCSEVIHIILPEMVQRNNKHLCNCLEDLLSALIKLSQDEEHEVRLSGQRVMSTLRKLDRIDSKVRKTGGRLEHLIGLIATRLYDSNVRFEVNSCFRLLARIIFNHSKNYVVETSEERERLFDKTKLNTFADHVATIQCALNGLQMFFESRKDKSQRFSLTDLYLPREISLELKVVDAPGSADTGDYSWRLKNVIEDTSGAKATELSFENRDNNKTIDELIANLYASLEYFSNGYWNMLTDTGYTFRELSLYKRIAFLKFVLHCTEYNLENYHIIGKMRDVLEKIVVDSCSTTLLHKCLDLMR